MSFQSKLTAAAATLLGLIIFALVWFFLLQVGTVVIQAEAPYQVLFEGYWRFDCNENPCSIRVRAGTYRVIFSKPGFYDAELNVDIGMLQSENFDFQFVPVPRLEEADLSQFPQMPVSTVLSFDLQKQQIVSTRAGKPFNVLPFYSKNEAVQVVESPDRQMVLIHDQPNIYLGDLAQKRRTKIVDDAQNGMSPKWSLDNELIAYRSVDGTLAVYHRTDMTRQTVSVRGELQYFDWVNGFQILFMTDQVIGFVDLETGEVRELLTNFTLKPLFETVQLSDDKKTLWFQTADNQSYKLELL